MTRSDLLPENAGTLLFQRLEQISTCSAPGPGVTRLPFTPEHAAANQMITGWMHQAGLHVSLNAAGTLVGRRKNTGNTKTLLMGSHQDSIKNGGKYDGILGVALPILALEYLKHTPLPFDVEVHAFADEEGVRFPTALMGPRALAGTFNPKDLELMDSDGISLAQALLNFGGNPNGIAQLQRDAADIVGYLETHIEQGPVLESQNLPLGIVTGICGIERWTVTMTGRAGHAGTIPMKLRKDALTASAEAIVEIERYCRKTKDILGTVGQITCHPNVVNAIPGEVIFSLELRAADDHTRSSAARHLTSAFLDIAKTRNLRCTIKKTYAQVGVKCDRHLSETLARCFSDIGLTPLRLMSGATHDASAMADLCPVAMLFVRCTDGISHHPDEAVLPEDLHSALKEVTQFIQRLASGL